MNDAVDETRAMLERDMIGARRRMRWTLTVAAIGCAAVVALFVWATVHGSAPISRGTFLVFLSVTSLAGMVGWLERSSYRVARDALADFDRIRPLLEERR